MADDGNRHRETRRLSCIHRDCRLWFRSLFLHQIVLLTLTAMAAAQTEPIDPATPLASAPQAVVEHQNSKSGPCRVIPKSETAGKTLTTVGSSFLATAAGVPPIEQGARRAVTGRPLEPMSLPPCPSSSIIDWYERFLNGPEVKPLTPAEKARLGVKNLLDPFNAVTILGNAAISVGADSHSAYGPGMAGFGLYVGVSYSQDMTAEFLGTFLIPSIFHQDPHYHRMPQASIPRRVLHGIVQIGWTQGDNGKGMPNYANILGFPIGAEISDLYVPGVQTDLHSTAKRVVVGTALAPTDNFITEFLPDVARHIHIRVVFVQQILNQVARSEGGSDQ